ncbi:MAG: hypothetical protein ACJ8E3_09890 [Sphingomicrobium sp.]
MDLNILLHRHQLSVMLATQARTPRARRIHDRFARQFAAQIHAMRSALGAGRPSPGAIT